MPHYTNILPGLIFILLHFFVFLFNFLLWDKKLFHPAVLFSFLWFSILIIHFFFRFTILDQLGPLSVRLHLVLLIGTVCFSLGGIPQYIYNRQLGVSKKKTILTPVEINMVFKVVLVTIIFIGLPFYIQASYKIFLASQAEEFFKGLRHELTEGYGDVGPVKYLIPIAYLVYAINLYSYYHKKNSINLVLLIITLLSLVTYAIFATGRTYFLMILSIYLGIGVFANQKFSLKKYVGAFGIFILTFSLIGIIYGKGGSAYYSFKENINASAENLGIYLVTPLNALDVEMDNKALISSEGDNTLRFFIKLGMELNLLPKRKVVDLIQDYSFVPYPTNVYTYYSPYIRDFGIGYAWLMLGFFGAIHTWLYSKAVNTGSIKYIFYYAFLLHPLLLSFFSDEYLTLFSFWFQLFIFNEVVVVANSLFVKYSLHLSKKN